MLRIPVEVIMASERLASRRRVAGKLFRWIVFVAVLAFSGAWLVLPSYIEIEFPIPPPPVGYFWYSTTYATETNADMLGALYIRRQHRTGGFPGGLRSKEAALAWFADQLRRKGWVPADPERFQRSPPVPEIRFLKEGEDYFTYYRPNDFSGFGGNLQGADASVTVAVWRDRNDTTDNILVVTAKASPLRMLFEATDD